MSDKDANSLDTSIAKLEKQFGGGVLFKLGAFKVQDVPAISTGALSLDVALGIGGVPKGRIIEIYGQESSGKTTLAYHIIAEAQKQGGVAAFVDAEHSVDPVYASEIGVNVDDLYVAQPTTGEEALQIVDELVKSNKVDIVVVDSVAALVPKAEFEGEIGDSHVGLQARMMSQALRMIGGNAGKTNTTVVFINQIREKVGVMFGNPETTPGGRALKFWSSVRLEIRRTEILKVGTDPVGTRVKVKIVKNKVAPPFKTAEFDIMFGKGISNSGCIIDMATDLSILKKAGTWYSYEDQRVGQGRENAKAFLDDQPEVAYALEEAIRERLMPKKVKTDTTE